MNALRRVLDAVGDGFAVLDPALLDHAGELVPRLGIALVPVEHDHALHADAVDEDRADVLHLVGLGRVVARDQAADDDARERVHHRQDRVEDLAADVLEVDVDALGAGRLQVALEVARLVVDAGIEAEFLHDVVALRLAAGDADRAAAPGLGELADHAADRAGGGGHHDRLPGLRRADFLHAEPGRESRHAEAAQVVRQRDARSASTAVSVSPGAQP